MAGLKQISVFAENKPGKLEKITKVLADEGVNITAISISSTNGFGVIRFLVDETQKAFDSLRQKGFTVSITEVLAIALEDKPGGLHAVAKTMSDNGINMENAHVLVLKHREHAYLVVEVEDVEGASETLQKANVPMLTEEEYHAQ
jgi:hypothetical protein